VGETRFHLFKVRLKNALTTTLNSSSFDIEDEVTNLSASPAGIQKKARDKH